MVRTSEPVFTRIFYVRFRKEMLFFYKLITQKCYVQLRTCASCLAAQKIKIENVAFIDDHES